MAYQEITSYNSPNYTQGRQGHRIGSDAGHWWGEPRNNPTFEGVCSWLCNPRSGVSAHVVVTGTGRRAAWLVNSGDTAYHAGNWVANLTSIGIEMDPRCRDEDYDTAADVLSDLWLFHGKLPLYPHRHWTATSCPGNYDLSRLWREAEAWYARKTAPTSSVSESQIGAAYRELLGREPDSGGMAHYLEQAKQGWTIGQIRNDIASSQEAKEYERKKATPPVPEWQRNLDDIEDVKLTVLPAEGVKVLNLTNLQFVNDVTIPRGTQVDVAKETTVDGKKYYISSFAASRSLPWGIPAMSLGTPAVEPKNEKPEWLKNLKDIEDIDMWTRSETPVLRLADGEVVKRLPINSKVRITHATNMVGKELLVINNSEFCVETVYLNDKPVENPLEDIKKRLSIVEKLVEKIVEFLTGIFKNFKR